MWETFFIVLGTVVSGILLLFLVRSFKNMKRMQELIREEEAGLEELSNDSERVVRQTGREGIY